ncbi:hypothetical protein B0H14DRAFT_3443600 [Mycena olivaceomarginata]|nr:hypothetical protein B0H14DRAFT_3443600 [Mycena olivaceomarginata]
MDALLKRAAGLVPGRDSRFIVDPNSTFMTVLKSAGDLGELIISWQALSERMSLAQKSFSKYQLQFKEESQWDSLMLSPVSTAPKIYSTIPAGKTPIEDVGYLLDHVPNLRKLWPEGYNSEAESIHHAVRVPTYLQESFPEREPEDMPVAFYYSAEGEKIEIPSSTRSSYGAGPNFLPPVDQGTTPSRRSHFRARSESPKRSAARSSSPKRERRKKAMEANVAYADALPQTIGISGILGGGTQFKKPEENLIPRSPGQSTFHTSIPSHGLPDPLRGMASVSSVYYTAANPMDSVSQAPADKRKQREETARLAAWGNKGSTPLGNIEELEERTFHQAYAGRPLPPHFVQTKQAESSQRRDTSPTREASRRSSVHGEREHSRGRSSTITRRPESRLPLRQQAGAGGDGDPPDDEGNGDGGPPRRPDGPRRPPPRRQSNRSPGNRRTNRSRSPPNDPPPPSDHGGDGPSSSSSSSFGGKSDHRFPYIVPGAPYGTMVPTIDPKFKLDALPEWDGDHDTAIDYFWTVYQIANLMGWLPRALGFWLPTRLKEGSSVQLWFSTLPAARQQEMRSHYLIYLQVIKDRYLGKRWRLKMNVKYEGQRFRQAGYDKESPQAFLGRRVRYTRLLTVSDDGGPDEVYQVMRTAPIAWSTILILESVKSVEELYDRINEHEEELVDVVLRSSSDVLTSHNLLPTLRRLGFSSNQSSSFPFPRREKRANLTEADPEGESEKSEANDDLGALPEEESTVKNVYQTLARRQRPPPKRGYPFKKNDHVTTKMGREPPSPCKVCGSSKHWDKECPDWNVYLERVKRGALSVSSSAVSDEAELLYHSAYLVLMDDKFATGSF